MKIAIITETLSTHSGSRAPIELAKHLSLKNQITVLAYDIKTDYRVKRQFEKAGIQIKLVKPLNFLFGKYFSALKFLPELKKNDLISFHGTLPSFLATKISGVPVIKTYYGTQLDAYLERFLPGQKISFKDRLFNRLVNQIILLKEKINFLLATEIIGISKYTSKEAQKLFGRKIPFIYLGSDLPFANQSVILRLRSGRVNNKQPASPKPQRGESKSVTILSVSRFTPYKGFHQLIEVFKEISTKIPKVKLVLAGSTPNVVYLNYLKDLIKGYNIEIHTDLSDKKLAKFYHQCDIYATCDHYLFFGLPIIEAAFYGKPAIALNFCAATELIINRKTGLVTENLEDFKEGLLLLIKDQKLRLKLGQNAKKKAERDFAWKKIAKKYEKFLKKYAKPD